MEGVHDLGGMSGFGPVVTADGELSHHEAWELRAQAVALLTFSSMRTWIERLGPSTYLASSYYERWLRAAEQAVVETGRVTPAELERCQRNFAADHAEVPRNGDPALRARTERLLLASHPMPAAASPRFAGGQRVVVKRWHDPDHHHRCPRYVRGVAGVIDEVCGDETIPGQPDRTQTAATYSVVFTSSDLWGDGGETPFTVAVDLSEIYLEPAS